MTVQKLINHGLSLGIMLTFAMFMFVPKAWAAALQLSPAGGSYQVGQTFDVNILLSVSGESVDGVDAILSFNKDILQVSSITAGSLFASHPTKTYDNTLGKITVAGLAETSSPVTNGGTVAIVTFKALRAGTSSVAFSFTEGSGTDSNVAENLTGTDILESVLNGSYTIGGSGGSSSSSSTATTGGVGGGTTSAPKTLPVAGSQSATIALAFFGFLLLGVGWWVNFGKNK